ncbi:MAG: sigma-70 family RNA polymerase sigma factor [Chloroflexota bacterium]
MLVDLTVETRLKYEKPLRAIPSMMLDDEHDLALVRRMAAGEDAALCEIYAACGQHLYAYALRFTDDPAQAEDVVQDTLVAAWKSARKFRGEGRVLAWLLGIVHHTALKSLRHRSQPITDEMEATLETGSPSPEQQVEQVEQSARLRLGLRALSPEHRAVLELVFYQGLSLDEVAQVCRVPLGTVKSRLSYARGQLRGVLTRQGLEEV